MIGLFACLVALGLLVPMVMPGDASLNIGKRGGLPEAGFIGWEPAPKGSADSSVPDTAFLEVLPDSISFGTVAVGYCKDTTFSVTFTSPTGPLITLLMEDPGGQFTVTPDTTLLVRDSVLIFTVRFCPSAPGPAEATLRINGRAIILKSMEANGEGVQTRLPYGGIDSVDMGRIQQGYADDTVTFIGRGDLPVMDIYTVQFADSSGPFQVVVPRGGVRLSVDNDSTQLRVQALGTTIGTYAIPLEIRTSAGIRRIMFLIEITRRDTPPPGEVTVWPDTLDFEEIMKGTWRDLTFTVTNTHDSPVSLLQTILPLNGPFRVQPESDMDLVVRARDSAKVTIRYAPTDSGSHRGFDSLRINGAPFLPGVLLLGRSYLPVAELLPLEIAFDTVQVGNCHQQTFTFPYRDSLRLEQVRLALDTLGFEILSPTAPVISGDSLVLIVRFCPQGRGLATDTVIGETGIRPTEPSFLIVVRGEGVAGVLSPSVTQIDFSTVDTRNCVEQEIELTNTGNGWTRLTESVVSNFLGTTFSLAGGPNLPHYLAPGASVKITIRFCPDSAIVFTGRWNGKQEHEGGGTLQVDLRGEGHTKPVIREGWRVWLDSDTIRVGQKARLTMHIRESIDAAAGVRFDSARIIVNRHSLLPQGAVIPMGVHGAQGRMIDSATFLITGGREPISGSDLFAIEFLGLSTGEPDNTIRIESVAFTGLHDVRIEQNGYVLLEGCDLEHPAAFTRRVAIKAVVADPRSSAVMISYDAPEGSTPSIRLINLAGERVLTNELPGGTGQEQSAHVPLTGVAPGFYILELRVADDVTTARIMVAE